ncbi:MAG: PTS sugar transporter subunit IIB [Thermodesulfobacteriota bacterium]|nr:MAG: PTS sugar transporter subunit IIB [Thermodesulfobacteriota bacterium]
MIALVRIDDRLLHGQVLCAWAPYAHADMLVVVSDEAAGDAIVEELMCSCALDGLDVVVKRVDDVAGFMSGDYIADKKVIIIFSGLKDAERAFKEGLRFSSLNIGNIHHDSDGRTISSSVIIDHEDEEILERFLARGVSIDIRNAPEGEKKEYVHDEKSGA